jgi:outer membrane protein TolC
MGETYKLYLLAAVLFITLDFSGCAQKRGVEDKEQWASIRNKNADIEMASLKTNVTEPSPQKDSRSFEPPLTEGPLTLEKAIFYAISNNVDASVKKLESDILNEAARGARLKMLPSLTVEGNLSRRNNYDASSSDPLFSSGAEDFNYSRDKTTRTMKAELSWDILDFSIAYYQSLQAADRYDISEQQRRRIVQNLKFDVVRSFYQAVAAKKAVDMTSGFSERLNERIDILNKQYDSRMRSEIETLETTVVLSEMKMTLSGLENELKRSKRKLATLMGLPPNVEFDIADTDMNRDLSVQGIDIGALEKEALRQRPELFEQDMEEKISITEAKTAIANTLPRPSVFYRYNIDKDSHLYEDQWHEVGVRLSFNFLAVPQNVSRSREAGIRTEMIRTQRKAVAAAILTQLRIAVIDLEDAKMKYAHEKNISKQRKLLMDARKRHVNLGNGTYEDMIESEAKYLMSSIHCLSAYADLLIAEQKVLNSAGSDDTGTMRFLVDFNSLKAERIKGADLTTDTLPSEKKSKAEIDGEAERSLGEQGDRKSVV